MSDYRFAPSPTYGISEHPFATWQEGFTSEEVDKIIELCSALPLDKAVIGNRDPSEDYAEIRESKVSWLALTEDSAWIYDRLAYIARCLNGEFFRFDLYGFSEHMQYTVYEGAVNGHYGWHQDYGTKRPVVPRKLSVVVQLSDPSEYEGGDLEIHVSNNVVQVTKQKGLVTAFPSFMVHRVTPVTSGVRKTLVVWVCGDAFK